MFLPQEDVQALVDAIDFSRAVEKSQAACARYQSKLKDFAEKLIDHPDEALNDALLKSLRTLILDRESEVISFKGQEVRVYFPKENTNMVLDVETILGRGIDSLRSVLEIIRCHNQLNQSHINLDQIAELFLSFCNQMQESREIFNRKQLMPEETIPKLQKKKSHALKACANKYINLNGVLLGFLIKNEIVPNRKAGKQAINLARDAFWKMSFNQAICTYDNDLLRFNQPLEIKSDNDAVWNISRPWYQDLLKKLGPWFAKFSKMHIDILKHISMPSMTRCLPNPPNAYAITFAYINPENGKVKQILHNAVSGMTEPFQVTNKKERKELTFWNQSTLFDEKLVLTNYLNCWGDLLTFNPNEPIEIPILFQTLISRELFFTPDWFKSRSCLDNKEAAIRELSAQMAAKTYYFDPTIKKLECGNELPAGKIQIIFRLYATNNCINRHAPLSLVTNEDVNHPRELLRHGIHHLKLLQRDPRLTAQDLANLARVITQLETPHYAWSLPDEPTRSNEVRELSQALRDHGYKMAILIPLLEQLKYDVMEMWPSTLHRRIANLPWFGINRILAGFLYVIAAPIKPFLASWRNRQIRHSRLDISVTQLMVANLLGFGTTGCMSMLDRGNELELHVARKIKLFHKTGELNPAQPADPKDFSTFAKKVMTLSATGAPVNADDETQGYGIFEDQVCSVRGETDSERKANMRVLRKGGPYPKITRDEYLFGPLGSHNILKKKFKKSSRFFEGKAPAVSPSENLLPRCHDIRKCIRNVPKIMHVASVTTQLNPATMETSRQEHQKTIKSIHFRSKSYDATMKNSLHIDSSPTAIPPVISPRGNHAIPAPA